MVVFFKFEEALYLQHGVPVSFVGHPCLDYVKPSMPLAEFRSSHGLNEKIPTVALLPGSRTTEIKTLLPLMLAAAAIIREKYTCAVQFLILAAPSVPRVLIEGIVASSSVPAIIVDNGTYDGIAASDFCFVCSGTATLETAILGTPMLILYRVNFLTWLYTRMLIKIPYIGLVNVVAGRKVVEEFIQFNATAPRIAAYCAGVLSDSEKLSALRRSLFAVKKASVNPAQPQGLRMLLLQPLGQT